MASSRIMDELKDLTIRMQNSYANLKKLALDKRNQSNLLYYEQQRSEQWKLIIQLHEQIIKHGAPDEYDAKFLEIKQMNDKFKDKLNEFGLITGMESTELNVKSMMEEMFEKFLSIQQSKFDEIQQQIENLQRPNPEINPSVQKLQVTSEPVFNVTTAASQNKSEISSIEENSTSKLMQLLARQTYQDLPIFTGNYQDWPMFINYYNSTKESFTAIENHSRLIKCLQGEAKNTVQSLMIDPRNITAVINMLEFQYGRPEALIRTLMLKVRSFKPIKDQEWKEQINLATEVKNLSSYIYNSGAIAHLNNPLLIDEIINKLSSNKQVSWHRHCIKTNITEPTIMNLSEWLLDEARPLNSLLDNQIYNQNPINNARPAVETTTRSYRAHVTQESTTKQKLINCFICKSSEHTTLNCVAFTASANKLELLKHYKLCIFCGKHRYNKQVPCRSRDFLKCGKCNGKHITALHYEKPATAMTIQLSNNSVSPTIPESNLCSSENISTQNDHQSTQTYVASQSTNTCSFLPTAIAKIVAGQNQTIPVRVLIDQCAERSYISKRLVEKLGLQRFKSKEIVKGINNITTAATHYTEFEIQFNDPSLALLTVKAIILPEITGQLPSVSIPKNEDIQTPLADPNFRTPGRVEVLLGNDVAYKIFINNERIKVTDSGLVYQHTNFGWIISGRVTTDNNKTASRGISAFITLNETNLKVMDDVSLYDKLIKFFELPEQCENDESANEYCEKLFIDKHHRLQNGKYVVPIPWKKDGPELGSSYFIARGCFLSQERKWQKDPILLEKTTKFMQDYFENGHMQPILEEQQRNYTNNVCYLPYHSILRNDSYTTKLRNVFNASAKTSNGVSLNDTMHEGQKLQTRIFDIITRSRSFKYIYSADITKMFRQIMILPSDSNKMRIIWRHSPLAPLNEFQLSTVTYGTDAAPWQAIRTIHQCAIDNSPSNEIIEIIKKSFYVDDLLYGGDNIKQCQQQILDISQTMESGCFSLTKWMANNNEILSEIPKSKHISSYLESPNEQVKLLGLIYEASTDQYSINIKFDKIIIYTKRGIASIAAKFYDPIGFILPFIMTLRIFLRDIWTERVDWDEVLSESICRKFDKCLENVCILKTIKIPRWIGTDSTTALELIGFADASSDGQSAVIYSRANVGDKYAIRLMAAKGNITKLKTKQVIESKQQTIPKLELEAILTLMNLYNSIKICLQPREIKFTAYTDSLIALSWVRNNKNNQKFIRQKVEKIKKIINPDQLHYVNTHENPADVASRGIQPDKLVKCDLYYNGPNWLQNDELPNTPLKSDDKNICFITMEENTNDDMFRKFSSFMLLIKVVALILRWKKYKRLVPGCFERYLNSKDKRFYFRFEAAEISNAKLEIIKYYQRLHLNSIITNLKNNLVLPVKKGHWLYKLSPFLDENGIIRVGGRLNNADLPHNLKHPIAIPQSHLKQLIISHYHINHFHAGNSLMLRLINENFWIPSLRSYIHNYIQKCVVCSRWKNKRIQPEMAQLPAVRVNATQPFEHCGVDLAGPFEINSSALRKAQIIKVWIVTFVCMSTKALHLEATSSLDTEHFLAAFDRFTSRRGVPSQIWSDNGRNFIGANRLLNEAWQKLCIQCQSLLAVKEIKWHLIPRYSPSFGGIWEASVKSIKYFVHRMKSIRNLTLEEFNTLLCKVEALLNSRPITTNPISPFEDTPLTPFHFLTQKGMTTDSIAALECNKSPLKKKWLEILSIQQHLWIRFQKEYLQQLQKKVKWIRKDRELKEGEVVLLGEPNTSPGEWKMGRVNKTYQDLQGVARKVDIKHPNGNISIESIKNLIPLDVLDSEENLPRPASRSKKISVTQVLLVWLACMQGVHSTNVNALDSGIHSLKLDNVYLKATNLHFNITTNYNITNDFNSIAQHLEEFEEFCAKEKHISTIGRHCKNLVNTIKINSNEAIKTIENDLNLYNRQRRGIQLGTIGMKIGSLASKLVSKQTGKFLLKHSPEILLSAGLAWQGFEISSLENQQLKTEEKLKATSQAILRTLKTEEEVLENHLKNLKKTQDEQNFIQAINSYSVTIKVLIETISNKYIALTNLQPIMELKAYIESHHKSTFFNDLQIPEVANLFANAKYSINNGIVTITYNIPLVYNYRITKYAIISVPFLNNKTMKLPVEQNPMIIVVNHSNYAVLSEHLEIYDNLDWLKLDKCLLSALKLENASYTNSCSLYKYNLEKKIVTLSEDCMLVFAGEESTRVTCNKTSQIYHQHVLLINTTENCLVEMGGLKAGKAYGRGYLSNEQVVDFRVPIIKSAEITIRKDLEESMNNLTNTIENMDSKVEPWHIGIGSTITITIIILLLLYIIRHYKQIKSQQQWFPNWIGPAIELNPIRQVNNQN